MFCYEQTEFHYAILNITLHFSSFLNRVNKTISISSEKLFLQQKTDTFTETVFVKFMEMLKGMKVDANHIYLQTYLISSSMLKIVKVSYFIFCCVQRTVIKGRVIMFQNPNSHISRTAVHHWSHNKNSFGTISLLIDNLIRKKLRTVTVTSMNKLKETYFIY